MSASKSPGGRTTMQKSRQQRRASLKASLHLQTLGLQRGSTIGMTADQKAAMAAAEASLLRDTGQDSGSGSDGGTPNEQQPLSTSAASPPAGGGGGALRSTPSNRGLRMLSATEQLRSGYSEQMLPHIAANSFKYVGGESWFLLRRTKQFFNWRTKTTLNALPSEITRYSGGEANLPEDILRLEVQRRDRERFHVASQVNRAIDLLMEKLDNDDFAAAVFTKEAALQSEHRHSVDAAERAKIVTLGMFHYFDKDHSEEIDAAEFKQGIELLIRDARRTAEESDDLEERAAARRSVDAFEKLRRSDLAEVFSALAGDDNMFQMDEFAKFYQSKDGTSMLPEKYAKVRSSSTKTKDSANASSSSSASAEQPPSPAPAGGGADGAAAAAGGRPDDASGSGTGEESSLTADTGAAGAAGVSLSSADEQAAALSEEQRRKGVSRVRRACRTVWTLLRESEDVLMARGRLDEIAAEQSLVEQTYQAMRDKATKTHRHRFPPYTSRPIPYAIMPDNYLHDLATKEAKLAEQEEHYRDVLAGLEQEGDAIEDAMKDAHQRASFSAQPAGAAGAAGKSLRPAGAGAGTAVPPRPTGRDPATTTTAVPSFCERLRMCLCVCGPYRKMSDAEASAAAAAEASDAASSAETGTAACGGGGGGGGGAGRDDGGGGAGGPAAAPDTKLEV